MKTLVIILVATMLRVLGCEKEGNVSEENIIKGKLVYSSCASVVVQVLDPAHYHLTQNEWKQSPSKPTFEHVFTVKNKCSFPSMEVGKEFTFQVVSNDPKDKDCVTCAMFDNPPAKTNFIQVIKAEQ